MDAEDYIKEMAEYADEYDDFVNEHWALDLLEAPGALVSAIETKISRAVLYEQRRIIGLLESVSYEENNGDVMVAEFKDDLIALIKGDN